MNDDPDKMSERGLRTEVKNLRKRLDACHSLREKAYEKGFTEGTKQERARILRELEKMR